MSDDQLNGSLAVLAYTLVSLVIYYNDNRVFNNRTIYTHKYTISNYFYALFVIVATLHGC